MNALVGQVAAVTVYPVRSLAGTSADGAAVGPGGLVGDRAWTVVGDDGRAIRAKDAPAMRDVLSSGDRGADAARLTAALGRPVRLVATPGDRDDVAPVHLVSRQAVDRAASGVVPEGCSADDPRANLVLDLGTDDERTWIGREVHVGSAVLQVTRIPKHCLGVYADVLRPGEVRVGDPVVLVEPGTGPAEVRS